MEYIIKESKLFNAIYQYLDSNLNSNEINWDYGLDDAENEYSETEENENYLIFYKGEGWSDVVFDYFKPDYYEDKPFTISFRNRAPILVVLDEFGELLDNMFDIYWHEPMKKWFEDKFNLPVKFVTSVVGHGI